VNAPTALVLTLVVVGLLVIATFWPQGPWDKKEDKK
jgi:hypothetical protein